MVQRVAVALATLLAFSGPSFAVAQEDPEGADVQLEGDEGAEADAPAGVAAEEEDAEAVDEPAEGEAESATDDEDLPAVDTEQELGADAVDQHPEEMALPPEEPVLEE